MTAFEIQTLWQGEKIPSSGWIRGRISTASQILSVEFEAPFYNDPPPDGPAGRLWGLWEFEVVEIFIAGRDGHYIELEFGPHGHHLALAFHGERNLTLDDLPLQYEYERSGEKWVGRAKLPLESLPRKAQSFNAYAIHGQGDGRRYLSCFPAGGDAPDFHQLQTFGPLEL